MSIFSPPKAPAPPPPPPAAPQLATQTVAEQAAATRERIAGASGAGYGGTDVTGGQGVKPPATTAKPPKSLLGG